MARIRHHCAVRRAPHIFLGRLAAPVLALGLLATLPPGAAAQSGEGQERSVRDGVYTEAQALQGQRVYEDECSLCHGPRDFHGPPFILVWNGQPLAALFTHIRMTMPQDNPGRLPAAQYAAVVAYILQLNGLPAGESELPPDAEALTRIRMERPAPPGG